MHTMLAPDFEEILSRVAFRDGGAARVRLLELFTDTSEMLAVARIGGQLAESLVSCADPDGALNRLSRFVHARAARLQLFQLFREHPAALETLVQVLAGSQYLADVLVRNPENFELLADSSYLATPRSSGDLQAGLENSWRAFDSSSMRLDAIRRHRRRELLRIGSADLLGFFDLPRTAEQLSILADAVVAECLAVVAGGSNHGGLIVLALGKLGGAELNYSSDIDLIFLTARPSELAVATRMAQSLVGALSESSAEGFLYRMDVRLRPYGGSGALVVATDMFTDYLEHNAHPAERQAMLKARAIAGDLESGTAFLDRVRPLLFVDANEARRQVRELKDRIEYQLRSRGEETGHVKLSPGGIRDVEFVVQSLQLEHGGTRPELWSGNTLVALGNLTRAGLVSDDKAGELRCGYLFARTVEHRLQLMDNQQIHRLPEDQSPLEVLARLLGFNGAGAIHQFRAAYDAGAIRVREIFETILGDPEPAHLPPVDPALAESVCAQLGAAYDRFGPMERRRHLELLERVCGPAVVAVDAQPTGANGWTVIVCAMDRVGLLSLIAGVFTANRIDIESGDVFTLRLEETDAVAQRERRHRFRPRRQRPKTRPRVVRKILDIFQVRAPADLAPEFWQTFRGELGQLVEMFATGAADAARDRILDRVSEVSSRRDQTAAVSHLLPIHIDVKNDPSSNLTELRIRSVDTPGFLFEFAATLAVLNINVDRVEVRTVGNEVHDLFWVTDAFGKPITDQRRLSELRAAAALIKQFTHLLPRSPNPAQALRQFGALTGQMLSRPEWVAEMQSLESDTVLRTLANLMGVSQFLWEDFLRMQHENLFPVVKDVPALNVAKSKANLDEELAGILNGEVDTTARVARLNQFKDREMFRIDLRHITGRIGFVEFSAELSDLGEVVVDHACKLCHDRLQRRWGAPMLAGGRSCRWCVCALGKFGGRELGFASDIELLFVYERDGETRGREAIPNAQYFEELVSEFLRTVIARREGIFEIDLRLRPHGKAGSLACSLDGFHKYFSEHGSAVQFERMALVKLRPVAGDGLLGQEMLEARDAFVYSGVPLDYENIAHLRFRQSAELVPTGETSAKHSRGGVVDIEYLVQAKQIDVGGGDASVRTTNTLDAIARLERGGHITAEFATQFADSYGFFRQLIDALRMVRGHAKDLTIPPAHSREFAYLARRLQFDSAETLTTEVAHQMEFARALWSRSDSPTPNPN